MFLSRRTLYLFIALLFSLVPFVGDIVGIDHFVDGQQDKFFEDQPEGDVFSRMGAGLLSVSSSLYALVLLLNYIVPLFILMTIFLFKDLKVQRVLAIITTMFYGIVVLLLVLQFLVPLNKIHYEFNGQVLLDGYYCIPLNIYSGVYCAGTILLILALRNMKQTVTISEQQNS